MYASPENIRDHAIKVRFTDDEMDLLRAAAAKRGLSVAAYSRMVAVTVCGEKLEELAAVHGKAVF